MTIARIAGRAVAGLAVLAVAGAAAVFGYSEWLIRRPVDEPLVAVTAASGPEAVARGERLSALYGCSGCHGGDLHGDFVSEEPGVMTSHAANLTRVIWDYDDAELARAFRAGVRHDGSALWAMPSESWVAVTDAEAADLIAFLRTHQPSGEAQPAPRLGLRGRWLLVTGRLPLTPAWVAEARARPPLDAGPAFERGRHIASTVCSECHASDLTGRDSPDLMIAASYDREGFRRLMRTGRPIDDRDLGLMGEVARGRFVHFTDDEIDALHAYLVARAERMPASS